MKVHQRQKSALLLQTIRISFDLSFYNPANAKSTLHYCCRSTCPDSQFYASKSVDTSQRDAGSKAQQLNHMAILNVMSLRKTGLSGKAISLFLGS